MLLAELADQLVDAQNATRRQDYRCPACHEPVRLHRGRQVIPYFAHLPRNPCVIQGEGETTEHLTGKRQLAAFFADWGPTELEHVLPTIQQRADVWVARTTQPVAVEFQCSPLALDGVSERTAGYHQVGCYPFWLLGHRYARQRLNWALIERFMGWLPRWELCLLFWDVRRHRLRVTHHLYQDAAGHFGGQVTIVADLATLMAGPAQVDPYPRISLSRVRYRWAQELARATPNLRRIQEFLYLRGHHLLGFPTAFGTTGSTPPVLGRGLLLWRIVFGTALFGLTGPVTPARLAPLAQDCFDLVNGHQRTVRVSFPHLIEQLQAQLVAELVQQGYLSVVPGGWRIVHRPRWRSAQLLA